MSVPNHVVRSRFPVLILGEAARRSDRALRTADPNSTGSSPHRPARNKSDCRVVKFASRRTVTPRKRPSVCNAADDSANIIRER